MSTGKTVEVLTDGLVDADTSVKVHLIIVTDTAGRYRPALSRSTAGERKPRGTP